MRVYTLKRPQQCFTLQSAFATFSWSWSCQTCTKESGWTLRSSVIWQIFSICIFTSVVLWPHQEWMFPRIKIYFYNKSTNTSINKSGIDMNITNDKCIFKLSCLTKSMYGISSLGLDWHSFVFSSQKIRECINRWMVSTQKVAQPLSFRSLLVFSQTLGFSVTRIHL